MFQAIALQHERVKQLEHCHEVAKLLAQIQGIPITDLDTWVENFQRLQNGFDRFTAIRILGILPALLIKKNPTTEEEAFFWGLRDHYQGVATWLLHLSENTKKPATLEGRWKDYEAFALLSEARLKMLTGLCDRSPGITGIFGTPAFLWLLCEAAVCRAKINNTESSKDRLYKNGKAYTDITSSTPPAKIEARPFEGLTDLVTHLDLLTELEGRELAANDPDFEASYWRPYLRARKHWGTYLRRSELKILTLSQLPRKRTSSLGKKRS